MPSCLIIDDEEKARSTISKLIALYQPELKVLGETGTVEQGISLIRELHPDFVFLDIQIGSQTGFDLLEQIDHTRIHIIFITAYSEYAIKAFELSALDYLVKPIDPDRLSSAIEKGLKMGDTSAIEQKYETLLKNLHQEPHIVLSTQDGIYSYQLDEIVRCEADGNYTHFILSDGSSLLVSSTLLEYEKRLKDHGFFRVHKKHLINTKYFRHTEKSPSEVVVLTNGSKVPLAWRRREELVSFIKATSI